jgi:hypothetical protein
MSTCYLIGLGNFNNKCILNLNFANDTLIFLKANIKMIEALKFLLVCFENLSGLKINYEKSTLVPLNILDNEGQLYATILGCETNKLPITYLGVPLHWKKLKSTD